MSGQTGTILYSDSVPSRTSFARVSSCYPSFAVKGAYERLYCMDWEINDFFVGEFKRQNPHYQDFGTFPNDAAEAWIGGKSTSQQGCNEVEQGDFLMLQANFDGPEMMDGVENYFILPRTKVADGDFTDGPGCNFSLYANC